MVHGGFGFAFFRPDFLEEVGTDRHVYLFQAPGLDGRAQPLTSVEEFANLYVDSMRRVQPAGPYNIVGMCAGSFIALEMCNQLLEVGENVARLVLLDPPVAPPAVKEVLTEARKRAKKEKSRRRSVLARVVSIFDRSKSSGERPTTRAVKRGEKMQRVVQRIRGRLEQAESKSPEQTAYTVETKARVVELLKVALDKHVPRPYPGKATMLVSAMKASKMVGDSAFWPNHLGALDYQICDSDHKELFRTQLMETARFVSRSLTQG
jgi:thioesterase domain-containing protein